jgi:hypothetical protein
MMYEQNVDTWRRDYDVLHLLFREGSMAWCLKKDVNHIPRFNETSIHPSETTFGQMARQVLFNTTQFVNDPSEKIISWV